MPLLSESDLTELRSAQAEACDMFCTVERQTFVRDTTGGGTDTWAELDGATMVLCRIAPGGGGSGGISGGSEEGLIGDSEAAFGALAGTIMTSVQLNERDRVKVYDMDHRERPIANTNPPTYEIATVRSPISYQTAVRLGLNYIR
jgi:hypothetical protein